MHRCWTCLPLLLVASLSSCGGTWLNPPSTLGESKARFNYVPMDPLPVVSEPGHDCPQSGTIQYKTLMKSLPDHAVRVAIGQFDANGNLSFGVGKGTAQGSRYQVVLDYVVSDVTTIRFSFRRESLDGKTPYSVFSPSKDPTRLIATRLDSDASSPPQNGEEIAIPVYVGVGLRITADVTDLKGDINVANLGVIGAEAQAGNVIGSMVIQTLGISGPKVSLPITSDISTTTIQNAMISVGSIKSSIGDDGTITSARVTGFYNPVTSAGPEFTNAVVSELAKTPVKWPRPCVTTDGSDT